MRIVFVKSAEKELLSLPKHLRRKIFTKIMTLSNNPYQIGSQKLEGGKGYRIRIGKYRTVYIVDKENKLITVLKISHRKDVYR